MQKEDQSYLRQLEIEKELKEFVNIVLDKDKKGVTWTQKNLKNVSFE